MKLLKLLAAAVALAAGAAFGQAYPAKPVRVLLGQPPGGIQDTLARAMSTELAKLWGQPVTLENRVGGSGVVAGTLAARAAPDGYTIFFSTPTNMNSAQFLQKDLPYSPEKDFIPVVGLGASYSILIAANHLGVNSAKELIEKAKANPGKLNYGSFGVASASHFDAEAFSREAGIKSVHVPYKGAQDVMTGLLGGQVDWAITAVTPTVPLINAGKIKGLGYLGPKRIAALPSVPTLNELGLGHFETGGHFAFYLQTGTPQAIIDKVATDTSKIRSTPAWQKMLASNGIEDFPLVGAELIKKMQVLREDFGNRIKGLDLQLQ
jgi:tripartite-type tricarboxylate transporter receptor subunit TctC